MDPDMVRQQEEAEREAMLAAKLVSKAPIAPVEVAAVTLDKPAPIVAIEAAAVVVEKRAPVEAVAVETPPPAAKKKPHPDRRALPPISPRGSRTPEPKRIRHGIFHGVARFFAYAIAGAMLGLILGNVAAAYLIVGPERYATVIFSTMGCFTLICALISILHHEH
jgi:hypothetical protein